VGYIYDIGETVRRKLQKFFGSWFSSDESKESIPPKADEFTTSNIGVRVPTDSVPPKSRLDSVITPFSVGDWVRVHATGNIGEVTAVAVAGDVERVLVRIGTDAWNTKVYHYSALERMG